MTKSKDKFDFRPTFLSAWDQTLLLALEKYNRGQDSMDIPSTFQIEAEALNP